MTPEQFWELVTGRDYPWLVRAAGMALRQHRVAAWREAVGDVMHDTINALAGRCSGCAKHGDDPSSEKPCTFGAKIPSLDPQRFRGLISTAAKGCAIDLVRRRKWELPWDWDSDALAWRVSGGPELRARATRPKAPKADHEGAEKMRARPVVPWMVRRDPYQEECLSVQTMLERLQASVDSVTYEALRLQLDGASWAEIGKETGLPPATIKKRVQRALHAVRRALEDA
jgi:DNA-directed RNA polymerase specialized sigma24 family protein